MKKGKIILVAFILLTGIFVSCDKSDSDDQDTPGNIVGMGNAGGELEIIDSLDSSEGIYIEGDIIGYDEASLATNPDYYKCGSGGHDIVLNLTLRNDTDKDENFIFNKGFVFKCLVEGYQHGICAKKVQIQVPAGSIQKCKLLLYCINQGKNGSKANVNYLAQGITGSKTIMELLNALENKKINVSDFTSEESEEYDSLCTKIQTIIWSITNAKGMSNEDWEFIKSLS